jgi:predicted ATPase/DNA-binding CsgD family transcriptional regulator
VSKNLPAELTSFVGRRHELNAMRRLMASSRLLTLIGPGGVGKTRLVVRALEQMRRVYRDGVYFVGLDTLRDANLLAETLSEVFGLSDAAADPLGGIVEFLQDRHVLLVLDNCEHLAPTCAVLIDKVLSAAPGVSVLATSRHVLGLSGEQTLRVDPFTVPSASCLREAEELDVVTMFADRAGDSLVGFVVDETNWQQILRTCQRLDGLPLAIELAVTWLRVLPIDELADRLGNSLDLLTRGGQTKPDRQKTLVATIQWSYDLASTEEQILWSRMSVFSGGATLAAIESVCSGGRIRRQDVLELVAGLVDKSVVQQTGQHPVRRYRMLDAVRQFGRDRLTAAGKWSEVSRRHVKYYLALSMKGETEWLGGISQPAVHAQLRREHANFRAALEFGLTEPGGSELALRLVANLYFYWLNCGNLAEARVWTARVLSSSQPSRAQARTRCIAAYTAGVAGETRLSVELSEAALAWARLNGDLDIKGHALMVMGCAALVDADPARARALCADAAAAFELVDNRTYSLLSRAVMLIAMAFDGDLATTVGLARKDLADCEERGEQWTRTHVLYALGLAQLRLRDYEAATRTALAGLRNTRVFDDVLGASMHVSLLTWIAVAAGRFEQAAQLLGVAQKIRPLIGADPLVRSPTWSVHNRDSYERTRSALDGRAYQAAFDRGVAHSASLAQAIDFIVDKRSATPDRPVRGDLLTRREIQVADLIGRGLTNKEIGVKLVIAQRTAETHVAHIMNKLGVTSRSQVATWLVRRDSAR